MKLLFAGVVPVVTAVAVWLATRFVRRFADRIGAIDAPGPRKIHVQPIPRIGGMAVVPVFFGSLAVIALRVVPGLPAVSHALSVGMMAGVVPIVAVSLLDDLRSASVPLRFAAQLIGALIAIWSGIRLGDHVTLFGQMIPLGLTAVPLSVLWIVGVTNAFNIVDGLDGLSVGLAFISAIGQAAIAFLAGNSSVGILALALVGALLGFLPYNIHPATVFLGDTGATAVGFWLACLSLLAGATLSSGLAVMVPVLVLGVPLAETLISMTRRSLNSMQKLGSGGIFQADAEHIHHRLLRLGLDHRRAVFTLYGVGVTSCAVGIASLFVTHTIAALLLATFLAAAAVGVQRLGYDEFALIRRGVILKFYDVPVLQIGVFRAFADLTLVAAAAYLAIVLKYDDWNVSLYRDAAVRFVAIQAAVTVAVFLAFRLYRDAWRYATIENVIRVATAVMVSVTLGYAINTLVGRGEFGFTFVATYAMVFFLMVTAGRSSFRILSHWNHQSRTTGDRTLVYGAGECGSMAVRELHANASIGLRLVGFVDDDPLKKGRRIIGYPVLGAQPDLEDLIISRSINCLLIASNKIPADRQFAAASICDRLGVQVLRFNIAVGPAAGEPGYRVGVAG